jgi:tRNA threonylcarbamoyladenosine biosynthesis protein TsaB
MLLAIDTSNDYAGIALRDVGGLRGEATWLAGRQHTEQVLPQIDLLLSHLDVAPTDLTAVAVATGPGSWSGLRAGISLAKALAVARRIPIIGIPALDALAYGQASQDVDIVATIRLGRDRYAYAVYRAGPQGWARVVDFQITSAAELQSGIGPSLVVGDLATGEQSVEGVQQRRAPYLAELAWARHLRSDYDDLVTLEPIYLGHPVR